MWNKNNQIKFYISLNGSDIELFSKTGPLLAVGYERIVIGQRGPYIEFCQEQIQFQNLFIPNQEKWRLNSDIPYYIEYRSIDESYVKVYYQLKTVKYADYKIGKYYISPYDLCSKEYKYLIVENIDIIESFFNIKEK